MQIQNSITVEERFGVL